MLFSIVKAQINLRYRFGTYKLIRVTAFINGEDFTQDISISSIDKNKKKLDVDSFH